MLGRTLFHFFLAEQVHGTLTISPVDAPPGAEAGGREIHGTDCQSVGEGLALIAVVILDPSVVVPADISPASAPAGVLPEPVARARVSTSPMSPLARPAPRLAIGAAAAAIVGQGPEVVFEPRAFLDLDVPGPVSKGSIRLSAGRSYPRTVDTQTGAAQITLTDVRLEFCFEPWSAGALQVRTCGLAEGGALSGQGLNTNLPKSASRGLLELGLGIRPVWALSDQVTVGLLLAAEAPVATYRFYFISPDTTAYRLSMWSAWAELGVGVRFL